MKEHDVNIRDSIVQIQAEIENRFTTLGTGFLISKEGHIATCSHLFISVPTNNLRVVFHGKKGSEFTIPANIETDMQTSAKQEDVTILKTVVEPPSEIKPITLGNSSYITECEIQTFGFPMIDKFDGINSRGRLIGTPVSDNNILRLQTRFEEVEEGFSGAPVWNLSTGEVIGMVCKIVNPSSNLRNLRTTFITPSETIKSVFLKKHLSESTLTHRQDWALQNKYKADWHIFSPFCSLADFETAKSVVEITEATRASNYYLIKFDEDTSLYWFDYGIGVWHIKKAIHYNRIFEFALERRQFYRHLLNQNHPIRELTTKITRSIQENYDFCVDKTSLNAYALSMVNVTDNIWAGLAKSNAVKLFCNPSILYDAYRSELTSEKLSENLLEALTKTEVEYLSIGVSNQEYFDFSVSGVIEGFASWAGVALTIDDVSRALPLDSFIQYEVVLQSYWWYLTHLTSLIANGHQKYVSKHFKTHQMKSQIANLFFVGPRDPMSLRLYKESIITTSRIKPVYEEFKDMLS